MGMRTLFILLSVAMGLSVCLCHAQENDSTVYRFGLPVTEDDTAESFSERDFPPRQRLTPVSPDALPGKVVKSLNEGRQYEGWRDQVVYYDRDARLFLVSVRDNGTVKIFGVNEQGDPVTFDEVDEKWPE